jgi:hypothetical protein
MGVLLAAMHGDARAGLIIVDNQAQVSHEVVGNDFNDVLNHFVQQEHFLVNTDQPVSADLNELGGTFHASETSTADSFSISTTLNVPNLPDEFINVGGSIASVIFQVATTLQYTLTTTYSGGGPNNDNDSGNAHFTDANSPGKNFDDSNFHGIHRFAGVLLPGDEYSLSGDVEVLQIGMGFGAPLEAASGSFSMVFTTLPVPEPNSLLVFGCAGIGLLMSAWRRRVAGA